MKKFVISLLLVTIFISFIGCHNYSNWYETEIPTNTEYNGQIYRATVKLPNEWESINEDDIISIVDKKTKGMVATQVYCEWRINVGHGQEIINNWDELHFNEKIGLDVSVEEYYTLEICNSNGAGLFLFDDGINQRYCVIYDIYTLYEKRGNYTMCIMFSDSIERDVIQQFALSYHWVGYLDE